jgi:hypothetical protein
MNSFLYGPITQFLLEKGNLGAGIYMLELKGVGLFMGKLVVE